MPLQPVAPAGGPPAKGPYSPAIRAGNLLFVSGQIASDPGADLATQTRQCLHNLRAVLEAGGATLQQVAKVTVYLSDPEGWAVFNPIYAEFFGSHKPARAIVPTAPFPGGFQVEVDAIAVLEP
jgi:2-iminobutanoate/2-iminopropanoate deaminase